MINIFEIQFILIIFNLNTYRYNIYKSFIITNFLRYFTYRKNT